MAATWSPPAGARVVLTDTEASVWLVLTPPSTASRLPPGDTSARPAPPPTERPVLPPVPVHAPPVSAVPHPEATVRLKPSRARRVSDDTKRLAVVLPLPPLLSCTVSVTR